MTREEAIRRLEEILAVEKAELKQFELSHHPTLVEPTNRDMEAYEMAISAIRAQKEQESNDPLTLDELREMDGKPVWIVEDPDWGHWELSVCAEDYVLERETDFYGMKYDDPDGRYGLHKLGWLAYRRKPEEGTV